ncbi:MULTISPECIES: hypothetical protein [unclassified Wolbachia]|uniref:hypothetical protein n=1 Tax=unclassified Wolbachia TaxID=2640676 RepID=UPI001BD68394|nr:hypothetical protein [Wolbachia endosymbiont of Rhagoletis cerasi]MBS9531870.1 hypothetical protein [Wolbachia endosymbiont of Rhagoletis cerasi]
MSSLFKNFNRYAKYGTVPAAKNNSEVPQNSFYKSVHYINSVIGPVKNVALGSYKKNPSMIGIITFALANVVLQPLYLALAYLSYWPAKGLAKVVGSYDFAENTKSLIDYSSMLSLKAWNHSGALSEFVNAVLDYAVSAVIWAAALVVTPLVWTIDKVASKFSDANAEGVGGPSFSK